MLNFAQNHEYWRWRKIQGIAKVTDIHCLVNPHWEESISIFYLFSVHLIALPFTFLAKRFHFFVTDFYLVKSGFLGTCARWCPLCQQLPTNPSHFVLCLSGWVINRRRKWKRPPSILCWLRSLCSRITPFTETLNYFRYA